jgi:hypothetical protein
MAQALYTKEPDTPATEDDETSGASDSESVTFSDDEPVLKKRSKGKPHELPCLSFANPDIAEATFKSKCVLGAYWLYISRKGDVLWYECKCGCKKRLKLKLLNITGHCQASVEVGFHDINHLEEPGDFIGPKTFAQSNKSTIGLKQEVKEKVITYSKLGAKPETIKDQLREEGIITKY